MLNLHKYNRIVVRLILVAFAISVLATPPTLADSSPQITRADSGAFSSHDLIPNRGFGENLTRRNSETQLNYAPVSLLSPEPAAAYAAPAQSACAPIFHCLFAGCWYDLLNNTSFGSASCSPDWVFPAGYVLPSSSICNTNPFVTEFKKIAVLPYASGFSQNFFVPHDATGPLEIGLIYAIVGTPTINDRIILEVREGSFLRSRISIRTDGVRTDCHRDDFTFPSNLVGGSFAGRNLKLRVTSQIVTPGVEYHISSIFMFGNL